MQITTVLHITKGTNDVLKQKLGSWYRGRIQQDWPQACSPSTGKVYSINTNTICIYDRRRRRQWQFRYESSQHDAIFPEDSVPISGTFTQGHFVADSHTTTKFRATPPNTDKNMTHLDAMLRGTRLYVEPEDIAAAIWSGDVLIGTDGSINFTEPSVNSHVGIGSKGEVAEAIGQENCSQLLLLQFNGQCRTLAERTARVPCQLCGTREAIPYDGVHGKTGPDTLHAHGKCPARLGWREIHES